MPSSAKSSARPGDSRATRKIKTFAILLTCVAVAISAVVLVIWAPWKAAHPMHSVPYLGMYEPDAPHSYADLDKFAQAIGRQPNLVTYYSPWGDKFEASFATLAAQHGAITIVQIDPKNVSLARLASGQFDSYIRSYATAVKAFGRQLVLSFGHEMNGTWYSWGFMHTSASIFVTAWRHIVTVFRAAGVDNVTWLWTVNVIDKYGPIIPSPDSWWPGSSYVNWVGIDGYYYKSSQTFAELFGPTIVDVRALTSDPILIAETGASRAAGQPAKVTDLFTGMQTFGLLGFIWFDADDTAQGLDWRLTGSAALATYREDANAFIKPPAA